MDTALRRSVKCFAYGERMQQRKMVLGFFLRPKTVVLSRSERAIARLVAQGCSDKAIASRVGLSEAGVRNKLVLIFKKLAVAGLLDRLLYVGDKHKRRRAC